MDHESTPTSRVRALAWAALLGRWMAVAKSAVAVPDDEPGRAWKKCVSDLIGLEAVRAALNDWDLLIPEDRALAVDRSALAVEKHLENLRRHLGPGPWTEGLESLVRETLDELRKARARLAAGGEAETL